MRFSPPTSLLALVAILGSACAADRDARPARGPAPVPDAGTAGASPARQRPEPAGAPSDEERAYQAELDLRDHLADRRVTFAAVGQAAPRHPFRVPAKGPSPKREAITRAELVTFGRSSSLPRCDREPLAPSGAYCPDVVAPVAAATDDELEALVPIAQGKLGQRVTMRDGGRHVMRAVMRCGFDPHHAVVFFDRDGRVVGTIVVCFTCHEWIVAPGNDENGGDAPSVMSDAERTKLQAIFEAHRLGARLYADDDYADRVRGYERRIYGTRELPTEVGLERRRRRLLVGSGVPKDRPLRDLAQDERKKLCEFFGSEVRPRRGAAGYECEDGRRYGVDDDPATCAKAPSPCGATVGEVEACLAVFHEPNDLCGVAKSACKPLLSCLPGVRVLP